MKKVISLMLSVLLIFSACGAVLAFAEDAKPADATVYTITFLNYDGSTIAKVPTPAWEAPVAPEAVRETVVDGNTRYEYIFKGWYVYDTEKKAIDYEAAPLTGYHKGSMPAATKDVTYIAVYSEQKYATNTLMQFFQSIFDRINMIFAYFEKIFGDIVK